MAEVEIQQLGPYSITELLQTNATSALYRGKQGKKSYIIKRLTIPLPTAEAKEAFLARTRQLKKLTDRSTVYTRDANFDGDYGYVVMEYEPGESLRTHIAPGEKLAPEKVKQYLSPIASALHNAHTRNTIHGNLHPGNLLLGERNSLLLIEFALALPGSPYQLDDEAFAIPYMAPEHLSGQPTITSDQYALAGMVYEWLCGQRPYTATDRDLLLAQQEQSTIPAPRSLNPALSPAIESVVLHALSREPAERFPHIQAFADDYLHALMGFDLHYIGPKAATISTSFNRTHPAKIPMLPPSTPLTPSPEAPTGNENREETSISRPALSSPPLPAIKQKTPRAKLTSPKTPPITPLLNENENREGEEASAPTQKEHKDTQEPAQPASTPRPISSSEARLQSIIDADLRQGGVLSQSLPGYEERLAQIEMAKIVAHALVQNVPAVLEAPTGTGKGFAYLLPIVRSGKVAIVSTANKALQEQLFYKDIPFVQQHIKEFDAALVKGIGNYVCLDRVQTEHTGMQYYAKNRDFKRLLDVMNDQESEFTGDFETLGFQLASDLRGRIAADSDQCAWTKCGFFSDCYVRKMREHAELAQVIVVNHTLLLLDAAIGGFLLPERDVIILDEAHHLEEEATRSFTITISPPQINSLLAQRLLKDHSQVSLQDEALKMAFNLWARLEQVADPGFKGRLNLETQLEEGLKLATSIADLTDSLRRQRPKDMPEKEGQLYDKLLKRCQNLAENIRTVFSVAQPDKYVYYVERVKGSDARAIQLQVSASPLDVTSWLKEKLFDKCNVICTSATLATIGPNPLHPEQKGPNFTYFRRRIGLDPVERPDVQESILPLTFDYESNALLYLPRDLPAPAYGPGSDDYMLSIAREMYKLVKLSRGRAFLLFSSKRMLDRAYELMAPHLPYPLLKQGDMTRLELTRRFREEEGSVLFGLKSFWEGVDIAGEALSMVVIDKLPFDPPDDPVHEARVAHMKAAGENWFGAYVLPQAVLRLKQGLGRLLRTRDDRGVMAILDTRLHTKGYGKQVLNAMPPARRTANLRDVERFFAQE